MNKFIIRTVLPKQSDYNRSHAWIAVHEVAASLFRDATIGILVLLMFII